MSYLKTNPVQALRRILRDHYHFPAIIKELLQNADDAKARRFHIAWTLDWPAAAHPLLTSPALLVLNDGEFRKADAKAICHLDEGSKGDDLTAIGKYGLGMKSVFHLCEAFFFAASPNQPATNGLPFLDILNPWPEGSPHDCWNDVTGATPGIFQRLASWNHGCDRWFCIVIPLRTSSQLAGSEPIVQGQFPSIAEFRKEHNDLQLVRYLPLLRSLGEVVVWDWDERQRVFALKSRIMADGARREPCSFPRVGRGERKRIYTKFLLENPENSASALAVGVESLLADDRFRGLKTDPRWPKNLTINPATGVSEDHSEKAEPHCAAVFSAYPATRGRLDVDMAVFLPLSKRIFDAVECSGTAAYQLLLHGQFFLDAGRRELYETDGANDGVQAEWNALLLNEGALPLVIPALDAFRLGAGLSDAEIEGLTRALERSSLVGKYREHICRQSNWIWRLTFDESHIGVWASVPAHEGFLELPQVAAEEVSDYAELFSSLPALVCRVAVTLQDKPRLVASDPLNWSGAPDYLDTLLSSISPDVLSDGKHLRLLASFLDRCRDTLPTGSKRILIEKVGSAIANTGIARFRESLDAFRGVLMALGPSSWVRLGSVDRDAEPMFRDLNRLSLGVLVLPHDLAPQHSQAGKLEIAAATKVLAWLEQTATQRPTARTAAVAIRVAESTEGSQQARVEALGAFRVFLIRDAGGREELVSWDTLCQLATEKRLFAGRSDYLVALQKALRGVSAYSLFAPTESQPFRSLLDLSESPSCNRHACVEFLCQRKPALGTLVDRLDLLDRLIGGLEGLPSREHLMAVRYLIHSSREHCDDVDTSLLARSNLSVGGTIGKIAECALRRLGSEWRWVPDAVYERLSPSQLREFRIEAVGGEVLESILAESGVDWLAASSLNPDEIMVLLVQIQDPDLWRRIPLHETVGGDRVALTGRHAYIQSDVGQAVPTTLSSAVTILRRPHDIGLFTKYMDFRVRSWDDVAAIHVALSQPEPQRFAGDVLDAVDRLACGSGSLSQETLSLLRETPWVPCGPRVVAPEQVVSLREAEDELRRLASDVALQPGLVCHFQLDPLVTEHPSFGKLRQRQVFPDRDGSLAVLGDRLTGLPRYSLGDLMEVADADSMRALLCAFDGTADAVLPGLRVLGVLTRVYPESGSVILGTILPAVRGVLDIDVLQQCLHALSERHEAATRQDRKTCEEVFRWYLRQLLGARGFNRDCLQPVRLLSRAGSWKSPTQLCLAAEGIDRTDLLDGEQAALFPRVQSAVVSEGEVSLEHSEKACDYADASSLVQYCRQWEGLVPRPLLGAFLSLLGDQPELREAANEYLPPHSLEFVRGQIEWPVYQGTMTTGADEDIWTSMGKQRFIVRFGDAHTRARVPNLVGGVFEATVGDDISSVFIGDLFFTRLRVSQPPYRTKPITVRRFDVAALSVEQRKSVLFESARCLLDKVYNRRPSNLEALWRVLSDTGQFELEIVQEQLLQSSWFYFQQLGHARLPNLRDLTRRHDALTDRQVELRHRVSQANATEATAIENELRKLVPQLRTLLEGDPQVQQNTLAAVRKKMEDYEYAVGSIPFELFQNGDDAAAELAEMVADQPMPPGVDTIILQLEQGVFRLMHWGRPINEFRRADFVSDKGRERGYHNDLKKMLILTASDKTERSQVVTGKFGLGFKTVFFVSDQPIVVSGDLGFEVIGGFYPRRLAEPVLHRVREALAQEMPTRTDGTAIELPLQERSLTDLGGAMARAQQLLPVMLAFARQIKCCHMKGLSNVQARARWREKSVLGRASVAMGVFEGQDGIRTPVATRALLLRDNARGVIFFSLDASGLKALPDDVPTFWVTAPTTEYRRAGFAVNAAFSLDVGRKQLADSDENACAGRVLGQAAGEALVALYDQSLQWSTLSQELGFAAEVSPKDFWCSLWDLLASSRVNDDPILRTVIWERGAGMARLAADRPAIPSGLSGQYDILTPDELQGLHAKLIIADAGWNARIWTGSANATDAAFNTNVEFMVELTGKKSLCGIDALLGGQDNTNHDKTAGRTRLIDMLEEYHRSDSCLEPDPVREELEAACRNLRQQLAAACMEAQATIAGDASRGEYELCVLRPASAALPLPTDTSLRCWPITLPDSAAVVPELTARQPVARFALSFKALTSFFAFEITARNKGKKLTTRFVLNLPLRGAPEDRQNRILLALLENRRQVLRYLLMLLAEDGGMMVVRDLGTDGREDSGAEGDGNRTGMPLLEALLSTLERQPSRLDQVAQLVKDLRSTAEGRALLPERFDEIWEPIWELRGRRSHG